MAGDTEAANDTKNGSGPGVIGLITLAIAAAASSFAVAFLMSPSVRPENGECKVTSVEIVKEPPLIAQDQAFFELQELIVTIGSAPATRYLKMNIAIATDSKSLKTVKVAEPVLIDAFLNYLRSTELNDFEDPAFYARMREQLAYRAELILGGQVSDGILITEFLLR